VTKPFIAMTAQVSIRPRPAALPQDYFRSVVAALIILLTIYGWINALGRTTLRHALMAQTRLWWVEQIVAFVLAIVCIGIIFRRPAFLTPAFWLTVYSIVFDIMRWIFQLIDHEIFIPVPLLLYALFLWRLWITRKQVAATDDTVVVETTG
jgi:hypothetical protein